MAERRSLSAAVSSPVPGVDQDIVRSFVTQNQALERPVTSPVTIADDSRKTIHQAVSKQEASEPKPTRSKPKKLSRLQPVGLIPVSIRLRPEIAGALKRASLERELEGEEVFTQQDIVESALEPWLQSQGYL